MNCLAWIDIFSGPAELVQLNRKKLIYKLVSLEIIIFFFQSDLKNNIRIDLVDFYILL